MVPVSLAATNKLICASQGPVDGDIGGRPFTVRGGAGGLTREALGSPTFDSGLRGSNKLWQGSIVS